jgi:hypothetical protein
MISQRNIADDLRGIRDKTARASPRVNVAIRKKHENSRGIQREKCLRDPASMKNQCSSFPPHVC